MNVSLSSSTSFYIRTKRYSPSLDVRIDRIDLEILFQEGFQEWERGDIMNGKGRSYTRICSSRGLPDYLL